MMSEIDRISELPECLITQILSYLPIKESMKTSVLATSWKNHWLHVPVLDLNYYEDFSSQSGLFISFIDRFLTESTLQKFKVKSSSVEIEEFKDQIRRLIDQGIQHLHLKGCKCKFYRIYPYNEFMPLNLYTCKTLVSLKLSRFALEDGVVNLPCLKLMDLRNIQWVGHMSLEKLLSGCPVLEELTFRRNLNQDHYHEPVVMCVKSWSLKRFSVPFKHRYNSNCLTQKNILLEIDAPKMEYMSLKEDHFDTTVVKNLTSLSTIDLDIQFAVDYGGVFMNPDNVLKRYVVRDFLVGITSALDRYSKVGLIPKFNNLSNLQAIFPLSSFQFLPVLLESCPNLKHTIWKVVYSWETETFQVVNVPRCFVSTLECVEIQGFFDWKEDELKIVSYFLENSAVLKKLILRFAHISYPRKRCVTDSEIYEELNNLTKHSRGCHIFIDHEAL